MELRFMVVNAYGKRYVFPFGGHSDSEALHAVLCEWHWEEYTVSFQNSAPNRRNVSVWYYTNELFS